MFSDTIAAISTALQKGAISIVRLSGPDALTIANTISTRDITKQEANTILFTHLVDGPNPLDEALVSVFKEPKSFTGEDIVEINCHGGTAVTRKVLELLLENGARLAKPGEFTQRAFLNGRMDLTQAEAVQDMVDAQDEGAVRLAAQGLAGSVPKLVQPLIDSLLDTIGRIEVNIDYPEYDDVAEMTSTELLPACRTWLAQIEQILASARSGQKVKDGLNVVIVGRPNVGKSSLLNALLEEDKAIVTNIPGTTRDVVEGRVYIHGIALNLIDTAGLRQTEDEIERMGIEKSRQKLEQADLVLAVFDGSRPLDDEDKALMEAAKTRRHLIIWNKKDIAPHSGINISAQQKDLDPLRQALETMYEEDILSVTPILSNERQTGLLGQAKAAMMKAIEALEWGISPDLVSEDLQACRRFLQEILGEVHRDDLLDSLFSRFCLGK
jgi:tRNA modification GTPase